MSFTERLQQAARNSGAGTSQSEIALALGVNRQTVHRWFKGGEPDADQLLGIAKRFGVDPDWLKNGTGSMQPRPPEGLSQEERELIQNYRQATPKVREVVRMMTRAVRKAIVAGAFAIPPLLMPQQADAMLHKSNVAHNYSKSMIIIRIVRRFLSWLVRGVEHQGFLTPQCS